VGEGQLEADFTVTVDAEVYDPDGDQVNDMMETAVKSGKVGGLNVDPQSLKLEAPGSLITFLITF